MPLYEYTALSAEGAKVSGTMEAATEAEAKERLRAEGILLTGLFPATAKRGRRRLKGDALVAFTTLLAQLVDAGVPLYESLTAIAEQYRDEPYHPILSSVCEQIKGGSSLSEALAEHPDSFDGLYCAMVAAGEASGALATVMARLATLLERQQKMRQQISTALIYPSVLATFSLAVIILLLTFVVPSLEALFEGRRLNTFTTAVLAISAWLRSYWWLYLPLIAGGGVVAWWQLRSAVGRRWLQGLMLRLPLIKTATSQAALSRYCRTMATLQEGGVTLIESMQIARGVMNNAVLEEEMATAEEQVVGGSSLSKELARSRWIPPMVPRMVGIGEEAGALGAMFHKIADLYEQDLDKTLTRVMALAQPLILIVMGSIIGLIMLAILLPLTDVSALMG